MAKLMAVGEAFGMALLPLLVACTGADARFRPTDRASQVPLIIEEVLRYEIQEAKKDAGGELHGGVCVAVRDGTTTGDPGEEIMSRLGGPEVRPRSACDVEKGLTLVAGPVEWVQNNEVRVKGAVLRAGLGEKSLAYRVVREDGRWACAGPILSWDPL
jgi:hypothetical protein